MLTGDVSNSKKIRKILFLKANFCLIFFNPTYMQYCEKVLKHLSMFVAMFVVVHKYTDMFGLGSDFSYYLYNHPTISDPTNQLPNIFLASAYH